MMQIYIAALSGLAFLSHSPVTSFAPVVRSPSRSSFSHRTDLFLTTRSIETRRIKSIPAVLPLAATSLAVDEEVQSDQKSTKVIGTTLFVLPHNANEISSKFGSYSPIGSPSILDAMNHVKDKISWFSDETVDAEIIVLPPDGQYDEFKMKMVEANALIALNIVKENDIKFLQDIFQTRTSSNQDNLCQFALECNDTTLPTIVGPHDDTSPASTILGLFPWTKMASGKRMEDQMLGLFDRWTSDDFTVALMLFFNQYAGTIDWVKYSIDATWEKGPAQNAQEFYNMISKCGDCITKCVADEKCKECLDTLTTIDTRDQVASYRAIVSYESELLRDFSYCILQKNNIFGCNATIPALPKVKPIATFQGKELTKHMAKQILVGHLKDPIALKESANSDISWKVAAGANVAYDQFPSQNQIFYEASNGKDMWYDPVFRVECLDGRNVWCRRHYKVREANEAGTFRFSVLDNGVTSNEFWTIVAVADDLSWIVFHYAGAATAVGQR